MEVLAILLIGTLNAGTPLLLAGLGLLVNERSGVLNLGAEGMMLLGAAVGFGVGLQTGSATVGLLAGTATGMLAAALFGVLAVGLAVNAYAAGLGLTLFAGGLSALIGQAWVGLPLGFSATPGGLHPVVWLAILLTAAVAGFLDRTRAGLALRAIGESPDAAYAVGLPVRRARFAAVLFGGACCGLAGAWVSLVHAPAWSEGMVAGRGWIALALTAFATWRPWRLLFGAWLFGSLTLLQFYLQGLGPPLASQWLAMLPYVATIIALVLISKRPAFIRVTMPASLGKPFHPI